MRLAHFIQRYPPALGGSEAYFARLSQWSAAQGDEVTVFTSNALALEAFWSSDSGARSASKEIPPTHGDPLLARRAGEPDVRRYPLWRFPGRRWLLKALALFPHRAWQCLTLPCNPIAPAMWRDAGHAPLSFDAVHASAFPYAFPIMCGRRLARRLGIPFFITPFLHLGNPDDPRDRTRRGYTAPALCWLLNEADGVFVQTPSERAAAIELGVPAERITLQGLGVEPSECTGGDRIVARQRWQLPEDAFVVGHLANQSWEKGTNDLVQALEPLWRRRVPIYLLLAGPQMPNFTRYWQSLSADARTWVRQLGTITDAQKRDFYAAIDVFALPSRSDSFGLVLLEAWANGVPSVAYRAGGIADVICHERDGLLAECGNIGALSAALERLHADLDTRVDLGLCGQARLPGEFRWEDKLALVRRVLLAATGELARTAVADSVRHAESTGSCTRRDHLS